MPNSRIFLSIIAFLSGFVLIWLLTSWAALGPTDVAAVGSFRLVYIASMFVLFVYFWVYFFRRPRGGKTLLDGRAALSGSAFIVGVSLGYALIDFGLIATYSISEPVARSFAIFVGCTLLPIMAWLVFYIITLFRKNAVLRNQAGS